MLGRRLVMIVETDGRDLREVFATHVAAGGRVAEWEALMKSMQQPPPGASPGEWWTRMQPVFRLEDAGTHARERGNARKRQWKPAGRGEDKLHRMAPNYADRAESAPERGHLAGVFRVFGGRISRR